MSPSLRGMQLGIPTLRSGPSGPVNTVAPAIPASAVIGTQLVTTPGTWDGVYTLTYQWQRNTGSWVDIAGATSANYTPVDADFGRALRVVETADGAVSANSNETGLTAEAPAQSLGAELVTNGNFSAWTSDDPDGWTVVGESGSGPAVSQVAPGGGVGTGAARFYSSATTNNPVIRQSVIGVQCCEETLVISAYTSGAVRSEAQQNANTSPNRTAVGTYRRVVHNASLTLVELQTISSPPIDYVVDDYSLKGISQNAQLTAPSANMRIMQYYALPGSPVADDSVWLMPRISNFAAGNYWLALLVYTGSQWDINLYSVATFVRTSHIAATNIGATNGIRVTMANDAIELETTANGGALWTSRGTATNSTYQTTTGVNALWTSSVTIGNLVYAVP